MTDVLMNTIGALAGSFDRGQVFGEAESTKREQTTLLMPSRLCTVIIAVGTALIGLMNPSAGAGELGLEYLALRGGFTGFVVGAFSTRHLLHQAGTLR